MDEYWDILEWAEEICNVGDGEFAISAQFSENHFTVTVTVLLGTASVLVLAMASVPTHFCSVQWEWLNSDGDCVGLSTAPCSDSVMTVTNSIVLGRYGDGANDDDWVLLYVL